MYETQFGLSAPPFQLSPDPAFYFDSKGHSHALAYLKFGAYQGEGFIVVTGDIGAGKTTLVRTLLGDLNPEQVVAAQVVSTQLESGDLLRSIATAFGIPNAASTKSQLISTLEAFLLQVAASGRRALLVIDEAQNLAPEAIEEMRMLSNFQLENQALLQSFLVGQPELRRLLESKSMEQFRQRVIASCHLGPMDHVETRAYVEHRLHHVGWQDRPHFDEAAFEAIHRWTGGIPRRINLLCNRLLLAAYLGGEETVSQATVDNVASELHGEVGEARVAPIEGLGRNDYLGHLRAANLPVLDREVRVVADPESAAIVRRIHAEEATSGQSLICIVDTPLAFMKACALSIELAQVPELPPVLVVNPGTEIAVAPLSEVAQALEPPPMEVHLGVSGSGYVDVMAAATRRFAAIMEEFRPLAVFSQGNGDGALACSLAASKARIPVLRLDAGQRKGEGKDIDELNNVVMDRLADVLCTNRLTAHYTLNREGIASGRVYCFGSLMSNVTHALRPHFSTPQLTLKRLGAPRRLLDPAGRYILATAQYQAQAGHPTDGIAGMVATLGLLRGVAPVIWVVREDTQAAITAAGLDHRLKESAVFVIPPQGYLDALGILGKAACVVVGAQHLYTEEAAAMGVPIVGVGCPAMAVSRVDDGAGVSFARDTDHAMRLIHEAVMSEPDADVPEYWDGGPAARLAEHLRHWLPRHAVTIEAMSGRSTVGAQVQATGGT